MQTLVRQVLKHLTRAGAGVDPAPTRPVSKCHGAAAMAPVDHNMLHAQQVRLHIAHPAAIPLLSRHDHAESHLHHHAVNSELVEECAQAQAGSLMDTHIVFQHLHKEGSVLRRIEQFLAVLLTQHAHPTPAPHPVLQDQLQVPRLMLRGAVDQAGVGQRRHASGW